MRILKFTRETFSIQKIAQAITQYCYLYSGFLYLWKSVLSEQNRLRAAHTKLRASQNSREDFRENRAFQSALYFEKSL
jgi:hypothetical protein